MTYERIRFGRMLDFRLNVPTPPLDLDADTQAWVAEVVSNGGTVSAGRQVIVNDLVVSLKADGIWDKLDRLFLFAAENQPSALTDLVGLDLATEVNSPTFTADQGYTCTDDDTKYVNTNYNPTTDATNYSQNNAMAGAWTAAANSEKPTFNQRFTIENRIMPKEPTLGFFFAVNGAQSVVASPGGTGFYAVDREDSSDHTGYFNGSSVGNPSSTSSSVENQDWWVQSINECSAAVLGGSLTAAEHEDLYTHLQTYMTAVGL